MLNQGMTNFVLVPRAVSLVVAVIVSGIISGSILPTWAGELGDAFVPIQESTAADPAGFQLMVISIGILVTMVLSIFTVTLIYMAKDKEKRQARQARSNGEHSVGSSAQEPEPVE